METSVKALTCHVSQMSGQTFEEVYDRMVEMRAERGKGVGMPQADTFKRIHYRI